MRIRIVFALGIVAALFLTHEAPVPRTRGPMTQQAYVWQRVWTEPVREAVAERAGAFSGLVALGAEVSWDQGRPVVARVPAASTPGIALRIGPHANPGGAETAFLAELAASLDARSELQIDFDCASSKLDGYRTWVRAIKQRVAPVPVVITALPSWLGRDAFVRLVDDADGYVLQVHSLERPRGPSDRFSICDPGRARAWVERAARLGRPFRVALPTDGYLVAFDASGKFRGLCAEGPVPRAATLRHGSADPQAMAFLVAAWTQDRPAALTGILWYRLPVSSDRLNWRWPTLVAVMAGTTPRANVVVRARRVAPSLFEVDLLNDGDADLSARVEVAVSWTGARRVAGDGLAGFDLHEQEDGARLVGSPALRPGARRMLGWLRLSRDVEVHVATP